MIFKPQSNEPQSSCWRCPLKLKMGLKTQISLCPSIWLISQFVVFTFTLTAGSRAMVCNRRPLNVEFVPALGKKLLQVSYRSAVTASRVLCVRECLSDPNCASVNYCRQTHLCEMNSETRQEHPGNFITHYCSEYFDGHQDTSLFSLPSCDNCRGLLEAGNTTNGIFTTYPSASSHRGLQVYCDMETDGGGWTVIQRRQDGSVDFYRGWDDYRAGFGNLSGEFWIGNDALRNLTESAGVWRLRVELEDWEGASTFAEYEGFAVSGDNFRLRIGPYSSKSTAEDSLTTHNWMMFSTKDKDNDRWHSNCATSYKGAWWYRDCLVSNLNGIYYNSKVIQYDGIIWRKLGGFYTFKTCTIKIRPLC